MHVLPVSEEIQVHCHNKIASEDVEGCMLFSGQKKGEADEFE